MGSCVSLTDDSNKRIRALNILRLCDLGALGCVKMSTSLARRSKIALTGPVTLFNMLYDPSDTH